jgi:hypothetical protein
MTNRSSVKPTFLMSKGQRNAMESEGVIIDELVDRYLKRYTAKYIWEGMPDDMPDGFIEDRLFWYGSVSAKKIRGAGIGVMGAAPVNLTLYGTPLKWLPIGTYGNTDSVRIGDLHKESDNPVLFIGNSPYEMIEPYLEIMRKALNALNLNVAAMSQPVLVQAQPGVELKARMLESDLGTGKVYVPVIDSGAVPAEVLDLKATDHTVNLLGVIHDMDAEILTILDIRSTLEKSSGISTAEASAGDQELGDGMDLGLRLRKQWCDAINAKLGTTFSVRLSDNAKPPEPEESGEWTEEDGGGEDDGSDNTEQ